MRVPFKEFVQKEMEADAVLIACGLPATNKTETMEVIARLKGYELRRWESPLVGIGPDGRLQIFRPILDLHLSMTDTGKKVIFDNLGVSPERQRYLPYTPHTVGKAGPFFSEQLTPNLPLETKP